MNPIEPPKLLGPVVGTADFKSTPEDFQVEEILGFEPSGEGEHCFLWIEKTGWNSNDVATHLADSLSIRKRLVSHCGLKDKLAVTRQWFSLHLPGEPSPDKDLLEIEGVNVLKQSRNSRKLRRGSHDGNRFLIRLRNCSGHRAEIEDRWEQIVTNGVPNYFGPQRFGRRGGNVAQARRFLSGEVEIRDRMLRGILISAARSSLFNEIVGTRVENGTWDTPLQGDVYGFADNRSLILPEKLRGDECDRFAAGSLELTAPLWGGGELQSIGEARQFEISIASRESEFAEGLAKLGLKNERRVIRLTPENGDLKWETDSDIVVSFDLPKGTYATTVFAEWFCLRESPEAVG